MNKMELFKKMSECANNPDVTGFCVVIENESAPDKEFIINTRKAINYKMVYYNEAYNDDLELICNPSIRIVNAYVIYSDTVI